MTADIVDVIPPGLTALGASYSNEVDFITPTFAQVAKDFSNKVSINVSDWGCNNTCVGHIIGAGLKPECKQSINSYLSVASTAGPPFATFLNVDFDFVPLATPLTGNAYAGIYLTMETIFANTQARESGGTCSGSSVQNSCKLMPAVLNYTFSIENNILSLKDNSRNPSVVSLSNITYDLSTSSFDYAGISHAVQFLYGSLVKTSLTSPDSFLGIDFSGPSRNTISDPNLPGWVAGAAHTTSQIQRMTCSGTSSS